MSNVKTLDAISLIQVALSWEGIFAEELHGNLFLIVKALILSSSCFLTSVYLWVTLYPLQSDTDGNTDLPTWNEINCL